MSIVSAFVLGVAIVVAVVAVVHFVSTAAKPQARLNKAR